LLTYIFSWTKQHYIGLQKEIIQRSVSYYWHSDQILYM